MNYLANNEELTFTEIQNEILYLLGAGSKVVDVIGSGADNTGSAYVLNLSRVPAICDSQLER